MSQLIFATIGTSIIYNYLRDPEEITLYKSKIEGQSPDSTPQGMTQLKNSILTRLKDNFEESILNFANATTNRLSAEIITLYLMHQNNLIDPQKDTIAMLYSHTLESRLAAELNKEILMKKAGFTHIELYQLDRINGKDGKTFTEMVNNNSISGLLDRISGAFNNLQKGLFCFSGGYKGLIPIISNYSISHDIDMYCLFERSNSLIKYHFTRNGDAETVAYGDLRDRNRRW